MQAGGNIPALTGAPVGHGIGMLAALLIPVFRRDPIHLIDLWDPATVLAAMLEDHVYSGAGATFFLTSLLDHPDFTDEHRKLMRYVGLGGSSVPAAVTDRADEMDISIVRMYGSTEHPSITGSRHEAAQQAALHGRPSVAGRRARAARRRRQAGRRRRAGRDPQPRPGLFPRLHRPALTKECFDTDGWCATGDVGVLDDDGYLSIVDRKKDIIIRSGGNVSALEVEELVLRLPGWPRSRSWLRPTRGWGSTLARSCGRSRAATFRPSTSSAPISMLPASPGRSGPRKCGQSRSSRAPRPARSRSSHCATGCAGRRTG